MYFISPFKGVDLNDLQSELIIRDYTILLEKKIGCKSSFFPGKAPQLISCRFSIKIYP